MPADHVGAVTVSDSSHRQSPAYARRMGAHVGELVVEPPRADAGPAGEQNPLELAGSRSSGRVSGAAGQGVLVLMPYAVNNRGQSRKPGV